jgi:large subunit ribosomal protein L1
VARRGKRYLETSKVIDRGKRYGLDDAIQILKNMKKAKFDETVEMSCHLGVDPKQADQMVRGVVTLPHGTGKKVRVIVFAQGEKIHEAKEAGAEAVGGEDLVSKVSGGWMDFEAAVAAPDMMKVVSKLGRLLGPRGLMPSPKAGTVTFELARVIKEIKAGRLEFRVDRGASLHLSVGKASFTESQLFDNIAACFSAILRATPAACKGQYLRSLTVSTCTGPGVKLDVQQLTMLVR